MKRFLPKLNSASTRRYRTVALGGAIVLSGLAMKLPPVSKASAPKVMAGGESKIVQATAPSRVEQRQEQARQVRPENYDLGRYPVTDRNEKHWRNILWTTAVVEPQEPYVAEALDQMLAMMTRSGLSPAQMRTIDMATKVGTQLYLSNPTAFAPVSQRFLQAIEQSPDPEWVAVSLSGLAKAGAQPEDLQRYVSRVKQRFPRWSSNVYLHTTVRDIAGTISPSAAPPLKDLLNWTIAPKQLHLYVLCQPDRHVLCQAVVKDRNGKFIRNSGGDLWSVPLLLRSIHSLGWNFVRGQTPQGVYRVEGAVSSDSSVFRAYGQFPLINLFVPFEEGVKRFLPGKSGPFRGNLQTYLSLLPPSWRSYFPVQQSFWAGKAGRSEFRIHGTGDSPDFFSGKSKNPDSYNWNPTIGCLSALELYSEKGQLIQADMPKLLNALESIGGKNFTGYMVVVDIPSNTSQPIGLKDVDAVIADSRKSKTAARPKPQSVAAQPKKTAPVAKLARRDIERSTNPQPAPSIALPEPEPLPSNLTEAPSADQSPQDAEPARQLPVAY